MQRFNRATDFLHFIQERYSAPPVEAEVQDQEFFEITRTRMEDSGVPGRDRFLTERMFGLEHAVGQFMTSVRKTAPKPLQETLTHKVAAGALDTSAAAAFIAKSPCDKYAIFISSGMMTLLHKCSKIDTAAIMPNSVVYCNRTNPANLDTSILIAYKNELIERQRTHNIPQGAMVHLTPKAAAQAAVQLMLRELFIICHEIGHLINGDLEEPGSFSMIPSVPGAYEYVENIDHEKEYRADLAGFEIARLAMDELFSGGTTARADYLLLASTVGLFDELYMLAGGPSSTHPDPLDRAVHLTRQVLGEQAANDLVASYSDPKLLDKVFELSRAILDSGSESSPASPQRP